MCSLPRSLQKVGGQSAESSFESARSIVPIILLLLTLPASAQVNSWTKPTSGNWEEPYWSLGVPPAFDHRVMLTNAGWKAVQIAWSTVQSQPQSLNVYSIDITSPVDSFNTLLLNYAGFQIPLTVNYSLTVGSNAALTMHYSALRLATPTGVGLSIGGEFNQNDSSEVTGTQLDVGWVGPGVYNLNSGLLDVGHAWVGGPYRGVFNQNGGSNSTGIIHMEPGAAYNLRAGDLTGEIYFNEDTVFRQDGGQVHFPVKIFRGEYILNNGMNYGGVTVPVYANFQNGNGSVTQTGGTNLGPIQVGAPTDSQGPGAYAISGGVIEAPSIYVGTFGDFHQSAGTVSTPATLWVRGGYFDRGAIGPATFELQGGVLVSPGITVDTGSFLQGAGTNITGQLKVGPGTRSPFDWNAYTLDGGLLTTTNTALNGADSRGGFFHNGGAHRIASELIVFGDNSGYRGFDRWKGYVLAGGELIVPNITINPDAEFAWSGGTLAHSGTLQIIAGHLFPGGSTRQFGPLQLGTAPPDWRSSHTNSTLHMPTNLAVVRFRDSRAMAWAADATLTVSNWNGSSLGGGQHRIIFGNSAAALTAQQLRQIFFRDPGGAPGLYPAKVLPSGEIVPDSATGRNPPRLAIRRQPPSAIEVIVAGDPQANYDILRSSNLLSWEFWTNGVATNGTMSFIDTDTSPPKRFYKAVLR
jgi:hypothetical protein